jgi:large subunit ribosomal protein L21
MQALLLHPCLLVRSPGFTGLARLLRLDRKAHLPLKARARSARGKFPRLLRLDRASPLVQSSTPPGLTRSPGLVRCMRARRHRTEHEEKKMFAVIKTGGKQYKVAADDVIQIEKLGMEPSEQVIFDHVLMVGGDAGITVGAPLVEGASVVGELVDNMRGKKIIIFKKRRRQNSRRKNGHRQNYSVVRITDILLGGAAPKAAAKASKPAKKAEAAPVAPVAAASLAGLPEGALFAAPTGAADDLKKISGVGPVLEKKLNALGITTFAQVAAFTAEDIARVDDALSFKGRIERDNWLGQAAELAKSA